MRLELLVKNEEQTIFEEWEQELESGVKKMYLLSSNIKETGLDLLEEIFLDKKIKLCVYMGIDKKTTTKTLLERMLTHTKDVYVYNNNEMKEFSSGMVVLEKTNCAILYSFQGAISENKLKQDCSVVTKVTYDFVNDIEKKEYKEVIKVFSMLEEQGFELLTKEIIETLLEQKQIFSNKQFVHSVKSISQYLGKPEEAVAEIQLKPAFDMDIDFDLTDVKEERIVQDPLVQEKQYKKRAIMEPCVQETEETIVLKEDSQSDSNEIFDLNHMILEKADMWLEITEQSEEQDKPEPEQKKTKKIDVDNVSNYIFELPMKEKEDKDIKIPLYMKTVIPNFFDFDGSEVEEIGDTSYRVKKIQLDVIDAKTGEKKKDSNAKLMQKKGQTYFSFTSDIIGQMDFVEKDIARIIKLAGDIYYIEIVSHTLEEYKVWSKMANISFKGMDRKYGIM